MAQADQARARIKLLEERIKRSVLRSPIDGVVVVGDLKRQIGAPVKTGDVMFEICPAKDLRAELAVDEKDVHELKPGQEGKLATVSEPGARLPFRIESINPAAETEEKANTFKVRVSLLSEAANQMLPGMKGVAHVDIDRRHYAWIWTHSVIDWVRLKLWI
jgi:multidrug efflux pump subunit AcrA (membrane-fusion protein)